MHHELKTPPFLSAAIEKSLSPAASSAVKTISAPLLELAPVKHGSVAISYCVDFGSYLAWAEALCTHFQHLLPPATKVSWSLARRGINVVANLHRGIQEGELE